MLKKIVYNVLHNSFWIKITRECINSKIQRQHFKDFILFVQWHLYFCDIFVVALILTSFFFYRDRALKLTFLLELKFCESLCCNISFYIASLRNYTFLVRKLKLLVKVLRGSLYCFFYLALPLR